MTRLAFSGLSLRVAKEGEQEGGRHELRTERKPLAQADCHLTIFAVAQADCHVAGGAGGLPCSRERGLPCSQERERKEPLAQADCHLTIFAVAQADCHVAESGEG